MLHAKAVIVELGYRDQFDWRLNGRQMHLGQRAFDAYVQGRINQYVKVLGRGGTKILFLSVPWSKPPAQPNGSPSPAGSSARHALINSMLEAAARRDPNQVQVLDIDKTVSPGNHYQASVNGEFCRFDQRVRSNSLQVVMAHSCAHAVAASDVPMITVGFFP